MGVQRTAALALMLLGCTPADSSQAPDRSAAPTGPRTYDYALSALSFDEARSSVPHHGFNLDGFFSDASWNEASCSKRDFQSSLDPDQNLAGCAADSSGCRGGVDNQFPEINSSLQMLTDLRTSMMNAVVRGNYVLLMRVEDVDDLTRDDSVAVSLARGWPMFADCDLIGTPGQRYAVDANTPVVRLQGSIVNGRLRVTGGADDAIPSPNIWILGTSVSLPLRAIHLRVNLSETGGRDGNLGGAWRNGDFFRPFEHAPNSMITTIAASFVDGVADLRVDGSCIRPGGAIGVGFGFELTAATIAPTPLDGPINRLCGSD